MVTKPGLLKNNKDYEENSQDITSINHFWFVY